MLVSSDEANARQTCQRCGRQFPTNVMQCASVPSSGAVSALGISDPDDVLPVDPADLVDQGRFCAACVKHVNWRRRLFILVVCICLPAIALVVSRILS